MGDREPVRLVTDPLQEADTWYRNCAATGEYCVLLCFAPPHRVPTRLECPVVPVFAWEYDSLPDEPWGDKRETDWLRVLAMLGCALTHSEFTADVVRRAIRPDYPVVSVPAPVWDRFAPLAAVRREARHAGAARSLEFAGTLIDENRGRSIPQEFRHGDAAFFHGGAFGPRDHDRLEALGADGALADSFR